MDRCFIGLSKLVSTVDDTRDNDLDDEDKLSTTAKDLQIAIIKQLSIADIIQLCPTNRYWSSLLDENMWEYFFTRDFHYESKRINNTWYNNYLYYYEMTRYCKYINESCSNYGDSSFSSWDVSDINTSKNYCSWWFSTYELCGSCEEKIKEVRNFNERVLCVLDLPW